MLRGSALFRSGRCLLYKKLENSCGEPCQLSFWVCCQPLNPVSPGQAHLSK
ncbi:Fibronectin Type Iii Domain-Containing Protein 3B [Manis pentadactyla]|nr:Fibronectin Type Iii Domain-Containing Protein 3B [Manis pentadactyla]